MFAFFSEIWQVLFYFIYSVTVLSILHDSRWTLYFCLLALIFSFFIWNPNSHVRVYSLLFPKFLCSDKLILLGFPSSFIFYGLLWLPKPLSEYAFREFVGFRRMTFSHCQHTHSHHCAAQILVLLQKIPF